MKALDIVGQAGVAPWSTRLRRITLTTWQRSFQQVGHEDQAIQLYEELRNAPEALTPSEQARLLSNSESSTGASATRSKRSRRTGSPELLAGNEHKQARIHVLKKSASSRPRHGRLPRRGRGLYRRARAGGTERRP